MLELLTFSTLLPLFPAQADFSRRLPPQTKTKGAPLPCWGAARLLDVFALGAIFKTLVHLNLRKHLRLPVGFLPKFFLRISCFPADVKGPPPILEEKTNERLLEVDFIWIACRGGWWLCGGYKCFAKLVLREVSMIGGWERPGSPASRPFTLRFPRLFTNSSQQITGSR